MEELGERVQCWFHTDTERQNALLNDHTTFKGEYLNIIFSCLLLLEAYETAFCNFI